MAILGFELEEIARLLTLVDANDLEEIILEEEERYLRIRGASYTSKKQAVATVAVPASVPQTPAPRPLHRTAVIALPPKAPEGDPLLSPMVGTFYRSSQPGTPALVEVGQHVSVGQPIGLIEAMKVFSEVLAEVSGMVVAFPAPDGKLVQAGDTLVIIKKN